MFSMEEDENDQVSKLIQEDIVLQPLVQLENNLASISPKNNPKSTAASSTSSTASKRYLSKFKQK
jgi:hypothetical protein